MLWRLGAGLGTLIVVLGGVGLILPEDRFIYFSSRVLAGTPADLGLAYREVWFEADDGAALHGWWLPGRASAAPRAAQAVPPHAIPLAGEGAGAADAAAGSAQPD